MADQEKSSLIENLHPCEINIESYTDPEQKEIAEKKLDEWMDKLKKDISELLQKNGVNIYQMSFLHKGTQSAPLIKNGSNYITTKLALAAYRELRGQFVDKEFPSL